MLRRFSLLRYFTTVTGLLVQDRNDSFIEAVKRLQNNPQLWQQISLRARAKIVNSYSQESCTQKWIKTLQELKPATKDIEAIREKLQSGYRVLLYLNNTLSANQIEKVE